MRDSSDKKKKKETAGKAGKTVKKTNSRGKVIHSTRIISTFDEQDDTPTFKDIKRIMTTNSSSNKKPKTSHDKDTENIGSGKKKPSKKPGKVSLYCFHNPTSQ